MDVMLSVSSLAVSCSCVASVEILWPRPEGEDLQPRDTQHHASDVLEMRDGRGELLGEPDGMGRDVCGEAAESE